MWDYIQIVLSVVIIIIGLAWTAFPRYVVNAMRRDKVEGEKLLDAEKNMIKKIRYHGILNLFVGSTWLSLEFSGFINDFYGIALSIGVMLIGTIWLLFPVYAPQKNENEDAMMKRKAKRSGKIFIIIGAVFFIIEIMAIFTL